MKQRLDTYLSSAQLKNISRARVQKIIADGRVSVNGVVVTKKNALVDDGDDVVISNFTTIIDEQQQHAPAAQDIPLDVIYEDEYIAVINKPAGLVVHPGSGNRDGTVVNALLHKFGGNVSSGSETHRPGIVHRLDKDTTGALLVAKTDAAHTAFANLFAARAVMKKYIGFCAGALPLEHEVIDLPLARSQRDPTKRAVDRRNGNHAVTEYKLLAHYCGMSQLEFILHTGRTHQIRVHCAHKKFPIVHDETYGGGAPVIKKIAPLERPFAHSIYKCFDRHALHARSLEFVHPFTNERVEVTANFPDDFCKAIDLTNTVNNTVGA